MISALTTKTADEKRMESTPKSTLDIAVEHTASPKPRPSEDALGFGRYFTDHMFTSEFSQVLGWHAPRVVPYQPLRLDPGAAVLHYSQSIFEGMKAYRGDDGKIRLFRPDMNFNRMKLSAERLCMPFIDETLFMTSLQTLVRTDVSWIPSRPGTSLYLRPTLIGSEAFLGVRPADQLIYFVIASPVGAYYGDAIETVKIWVEPRYTRASPGGIGAAKAGGNYAASLLAAKEAKKRGYAQVLWLDGAEKRYIEEVGTMNVFFVIGDRVVTPSLDGTILPGVTRDSVLHIVRDAGLKVEERPVELAEIVAAHKAGELNEVFGTGTAAGISPVGMLGMEGNEIVINGGKVGKISQTLFDQLTSLQYGRSPDKFGWLTQVTGA